MAIKLTNYSEQGFAQFLQSHKEPKLSIKVNLKSHHHISYLKIIEDELSQLIHLSELSIEIPHYCVLSQKGYTHISNAIKHLTQLTKLSLKIEGFIQNEELVLLHNSISNLTDLEILTFKMFPYNDIDSFTGQEFIDSLSSLSNLRKLALQFQRIKKSQMNEGNIHFWRGIQQLQSLEKLALEIHEWSYGQKDLTELFQHIIELKQLKRFSLISFGSYEPAIIRDMIISYVGQMVNLKSLDIGFEDDSQVFLQETQTLELIKNLSNLKQLEKLNMNTFQTQIVKHHLKEYADLMGGLKCLKKLNIDCSVIEEAQPLNYLGQSLLILTNITSFELILSKGVYNEFISDLSSSLQSMKNLNTLKLQLGDLNYHQSRKLGCSLNKLHNLTNLVINLRFFYDENNIQLIVNNFNALLNVKELRLKGGYSQCFTNYYANLHKLISLETLEIPTIIILSDEDLELLNQTLKNLKKLKILNISLRISYVMDEKSVSLLQSTFIELNSLESLEINLNDIRNNETITKINLLQHLKNLKKLNIETNNSFQNIFDLSPSTPTNEYVLEDVKINFSQNLNSINTEIFLDAMDSLSTNFPNIKKLNLSQSLNNHSVEDSKLFSRICSQFANLRTLILINGNYYSSMNFYFEGVKKLKTLNKLVLTTNIRGKEDIKQIRKILQKLENLRKIDLNITNNTEDLASLEKELSNILQYQKKTVKINMFYQQYNLGLQNLVSLNQELNEKEEDLQLDVQSEIIFDSKERVGGQLQTQDKIISNTLKSFPCNLQLTIVKEGEEDKEHLFLQNNLDNIDLEYLLDLDIKQSRGIDQYQFPVEVINLQMNQLHSLRTLKLDLMNLVISEEQISQFSQNSTNIRYLINLRILIVKIGSINDHYCAFLDELKHLKELSTFELETKISNGAANSLGNSLKELEKLENCVFYISDDGTLGNQGFLSIVNGLKGLKNMQKLILDFYPIEDMEENEDNELISDFFEEMSKLYKLELNWRKYDSITIKTPQLYSSLSQFPYLEVLLIQFSKNNKLNQGMMNQLINSICQLKHLRAINIEISFENIDNIKIVNSLSNYFNRDSRNPLVINGDTNYIELVQNDNFVFKIYLNSEVANLELDFLEELNEKKVIEFNFRNSKILKNLAQIKSCAPQKLRLKQLYIFETKDANDICELISGIPTNIQMLQLNFSISESIMEDSLTQIANSLLKLKNLHTLCMIITNENQQDCRQEHLLLVLSIIAKFQQLKELYILTNSNFIWNPVKLRTKKIMKKLVKYEVQTNFLNTVYQTFNI